MLGPSTRTLFLHSRDRVRRLRATRVIMKLGVSIQLLCELAPYALVGTTVFTAALGAPYLASLTGLVTLLLLVDMALSECDLAVRLLGDAPRGAYQGKVVWITGASQGLGEALALHLASLGARLILSSRREGVLAKVCAACDALGAGAARPLVLDARGGASAAGEAATAAMAMATEMAGADADAGIDYLFHVAGGSQSSAAEDTAEEVDRDMFEINVFSAIALTKAVLPGMLARRTGVITAVCSMAAKCPAPGQAAYSATKAALAAFLHALRGETADRGVRVCVAHPGPIATGLGGQTRVVFGATLAKSTCDTEKSDVAPTGSDAKSGSKKNEKRLDARWTAARVAAGAAHGLDEVVLAKQPIMLLRHFMRFAPTLGFRVLNKVGPKRTRAARSGESMYDLKKAK